jgi:hypothetical protein
LSGVVCDGSGVEAQGKEGANEERRQLHYGCEVWKLILFTRLFTVRSHSKHGGIFLLFIAGKVPQ